MGTMTLPASGVLCIDANIVIYTVEKHPRYSSVLRPFLHETSSQFTLRDDAR